jgi:hypothetical protein
MKTNIMVCFLVLFLGMIFVSNGFSQDRTYRISKDIYSMPNDNSNGSTANPVNIPAALLPGFSNGDYTIGPEQLTTLTGWYDYMTNGDNRHWILMDPADPTKLHVHYCVSDSLNPGGSTSRRTVYAYSADGGTTWTYGGEVPTNFRSGFGYMDLKTDGSAIISNHNTRQTTLNTHLYIDVFPQLVSFNEYLTPFTGGYAAWGQCSKMTNNNILLVGESYVGAAATDTSKYAIFDNTTSTTGPWTTLTPPAGVTLLNQRWASASGANGNATVVVNAIGDATGGYGANKIWAYTSTNNGTSWGAPYAIFTPFVNGLDTIAPFFGHDLAYKPGTTDFYFAFNANGNGLFKKAVLYVTKNGGPVHKIADSTNVPNTATMQAMAGITGIDHPSIGFSADGLVMYCAFTVMTADTGLRGWNTRDVFYSFSTDDGTTWATPRRVTNTPLVDEGYVAISRVNPGTSPSTYALHMVYMKDPGDGPSAFNGTGTLMPATRNWLVYRKITQPTVGIKHNSSVVKDYSLSQNYPNPFNPTTNIKFSIKNSSLVTLRVYDVTGRMVTELVNEKLSTGSYDYSFNGTNLSSGVYFYTLKADGFTDTKKMMLIK